MDALDFLQSIAGYTRNAPSNGSSSSDRPIRLAVIDPAYNAFSGVYPNGVNPARVTFEGESTLSGKYYPVAVGYIPGPGQRVWLVPIGTTYMIAGAVSTDQAQGFYDGTATGVEFGGGNYFDTLEGLALETDASIGGALDVAGAADIAGMRFVDNEKVVSGFFSSGSSASTSYVALAGATSITFTKKYGGAETNFVIHAKASARISAGTAPGTMRLGVNISGGSGDHDIDHTVMQTSGVHYPLVGTRLLTGFAAGSYTIALRMRSVSGITFAIDSNDYYSLHVREVSV